MRSRALGGPKEATGALNQVGSRRRHSCRNSLRRGQSGQSRPGLPDASDIAGTGRANPVGAVWAGAMMLDHLGEKAASGAIMKAVEEVLATTAVRTPDLGGTATTREVGQEVARALRAAGASGDG